MVIFLDIHQPNESVLGKKYLLGICNYLQQGYGKSLWMMHGMFRANGRSGYVKKPDFLMHKGPHNEVFDPKRTLPVKKTLMVSFIFFQRIKTASVIE